MSNGNAPPNPNKPPQSDVASVTAVNRVLMNRWTLQVTNGTILSISSHSHAMGRDNQGGPEAELEPMADVNVMYEVQLPLADMSQEFQDAVAIIGTDIESFTINDEFPE